MTRINSSFNFGSELKNENPSLYNQLQQTYETTAGAVNTKVSRNVSTSNPEADSPNNKLFDIGDVFINSSTNTAWIMTSRSTNTAVV